MIHELKEVAEKEVRVSNGVPYTWAKPNSHWNSNLIYKSSINKPSNLAIRYSCGENILNGTREFKNTISNIFRWIRGK